MHAYGYYIVLERDCGELGSVYTFYGYVHWLCIYVVMILFIGYLAKLRK